MAVPAPDPQTVRRAAEILRAGRLVAFATETVYGLGADARNPAAVRKIFEIKGRPPTNPLIVHVADEAAARACAGDWPDVASALADAFWPGPLTLVVPRGSAIAPEVSAGLTTVGLRAPDHPVAQALLRELGGPIAAPSANRSNRVSPTTAQHVRDELGDAVEMVLDGGPCRVGIESTVLAVSGNRPTILRPGGIGREQIQQIIGPVDVLDGVTEAETPATSPGQQAVHYAPKTPALWFAPEKAGAAAAWCAGRRAAVMVRSDSRSADLFRTVAQPLILMPSDSTRYAQVLYGTLREADAAQADVILIELPPPGASWTAVRDRIRRAARPLDA
jgi:L-threonylcarbamoyladenylate synthase